VTRRRSWTGPAVLVVVYVVPVALTVLLLARVGSYVLAGALAVIEVGISLAVHRALHPRGAAPASEGAQGGPVQGGPDGPVLGGPVLGGPVLGRPGDREPAQGSRFVLVGLALMGVFVAVVILGTLAAR